jgi:hypothetical protein
MGHALAISCPSCGEYGQHRVLHTVPEQWEWNYSNMMRVRQCIECSKEFRTIELACENYGSLREEVSQLRKRNTLLQEAVDQSVKHLSPAATTK